MGRGDTVLTREMELDATDELIARLTAERDAAISERDMLRVQVEAAKLFGGGIYGDNVEQGTVDFYVDKARAALGDSHE